MTVHPLDQHAPEDARAGMHTPRERTTVTDVLRTSLGRRASGPVLFGVDVHTIYQEHLNIEAVAREGFAWMAVKVSQGLNAKWADEAQRWMDRGEAAGMLVFGYHYLTVDDVNGQAATARGAARGRPLMCDTEKGSGTVGNVSGFLDAAGRAGQTVPLVYLPRWYWSSLGEPSLEFLPPIVQSRYRTATGPASAIYAGVPDSWWEPFGGGNVRILQFSDRASVAGKALDVNAYRGTRDELAALIGGRGAPTPRPPAPSGRRVLIAERPYPTGADVEELQRVLRAWYGLPLSFVDGVYGPATADVVRRLQANTRPPLTVDGKAGPQVYAALGLH